MAYYRIPLKANVAERLDVAGTLILVDGIDGAAGVDITPILNGSQQPTMPLRKTAFKYRTPFDGVELKAAADCTVRIFLTTNDVTLGFADGAQVSVAGTVGINNDAGSPVPVAVSGGVTLNASNVGISNSNAAAVPVKSQALTNIIDYNPVVIPGVAAISLIADPALRRLRVRNSHATALVVLGGPAVSMNNGPIRLQPGDVFIEEDAAGAEWWGITDTPGAQVQLQGLK